MKLKETFLKEAEEETKKKEVEETPVEDEIPKDTEDKSEDKEETSGEDVNNGIEDVSEDDDKKIGGKNADTDNKSKGGTMGSVGDDTDFGNDVLIPVGVSDDKSYDVLNSIMGQMSDGIWENSATVAKFWKYAEIVKDDVEGVCIAIRDPEYWENGFRGKTIQEVKKYFAAKIKTLAKKYIDDSGLGEWKRDNKTPCLYLGYNDDVTMQDAFKVYDALSGITDKVYESKRVSKMKNLNEYYEITDRDREERVGSVYTVADAKEKANDIIKSLEKTGISILDTELSDDEAISLKVGNKDFSTWVDVYTTDFYSDNGEKDWTWQYNKFVYMNNIEDKVEQLVQDSEEITGLLNDVVMEYLVENGETSDNVDFPLDNPDDIVEG